MNHCITGWKYFTNPRIFEGYGRQKGWERDVPATEYGNGGQKPRNKPRTASSRSRNRWSFLLKIHPVADFVAIPLSSRLPEKARNCGLFPL